VTRAGSVSDALLSQVDLMATFAALLNFDLPRKNAISAARDRPPHHAVSKP